MTVNYTLDCFKSLSVFSTMSDMWSERCLWVTPVGDKKYYIDNTNRMIHSLETTARYLKRPSQFCTQMYAYWAQFSSISTTKLRFNHAFKQTQTQHARGNYYSIVHVYAGASSNHYLVSCSSLGSVSFCGKGRSMLNNPLHLACSQSSLLPLQR